MKRSMSVPLWFAVPLAKEPLGVTPTRAVPAHAWMTGRIWPRTASTGEKAPVLTASRARIACRYSSAVTAASSPSSNQDALDFVETDLVVAPVVEAGGPGALVVGHLLGDFEFAAVP